MAAARASAVDPSVARRADMLWRLCAVALADAGARAGETGEHMIERRNRAARELGFDNYWSLWLEVDELDAARVDRWLEPDFQPVAPPPRAGRAALGDVVVAARALVSTALRVDVSADRSARTYLVDPPRDVRVVGPQPSTPAELRALAHELGHGVYACSHRADLAWSLRDAPARWVHEGVAEHIADRLVGRDAIESGRWPWLQLCARFERDVYTSADRDADASWRALHATYLGGEPSRSWRDVDHFAVDPGPRYLAAEVLRCRLGRGLGADGWSALSHMMAQGASAPADQILRGVRA